MSVLNFSVDNHIAHLEMNRPEVMNALNFELNQGLADAWREVEENDDIWVAILSAHPDSRAFSAGMDLKERAEMNAAASTGASGGSTATVTRRTSGSR